MKKQLIEILQEKKVHYLIIFLVSCIVALPILPLQVTNTHDGNLHILRLLGTNLSLHYTEFPHLLIPYFCSDFGYCTNAFYSPISTYLPYLLTNLPILYSQALKIFAYFTIILSGFTMYHCSYEITKKRAIALLASIFYMVAPYRLTDIYVRFALAEFTSFVFLPIILQGLYNLIQGDQKKHFYLTIGAAGLVLTHAITAFYFAIFCFVYLVFHFKKILRKEVIQKLFFNITFILGLTAFHWMILWEFSKFVDYSIFLPFVMGTNSNFVSGNTTTIQNILLPSDKLLQFFLGGFSIFTMILSLILIPKRIKEKNLESLVFLFFALFSIFLCVCSEFWELLPDLFCKIQYPWRMMGEFVFFSSFVIAAALVELWEMLCKKQVLKLILVVICAGLFIADLGYFVNMHWKNNVASERYDKTYELVATTQIDFPITFINREYLPFKALANRQEVMDRENKILVYKGEAEISEEEKEGLTLSAKVQNASKDTVLELPYFCYPGYVVTLTTEGETIELKQTETSIGLLGVILPEDVSEGEISCTYKGTIFEKMAYLVSGITYILFLITIVEQAKKQKNEKKAIEDKK